MGWRFLISLAGLAGTVASVAGVSTSNHRSDKPALQKPTHQWKTNVDEISVKLDCNSSESEFQNAEFIWKVLLDEGEKQQLQRGGTVVKTANLSLTSKSGSTLWPKNWTGMRVLRGSAGGSLNITYTHSKARQTGGGSSSGGLDSSKIICAWFGLKGGQEIELYRHGAQIGREGLFTEETARELSLGISLGTCNPIGSEDKTAECNLKVTTNGNELDWSTKVNAKARLSFE